jgi:hypothetical protein
MPLKQMKKIKLRISLIKILRRNIKIVTMDVGIIENLGILEIATIMATTEIIEIQILQVLMNRDISIDSIKFNIS